MHKIKYLFDSSRGRAKVIFSPNRTGAEVSIYRKDLASFDSDGFTFGHIEQGDWTKSGDTYVGWCWRANGGVTTARTQMVHITSTVQANTKAGFSIVTYSGTLSSAGTATVGHGLTQKPDFLMSKNRTTNTIMVIGINHVGLLLSLNTS